MEKQYIRLVTTLLATFCVTSLQSATVLISNFDNLSADSPLFSSSWSGGTPISDQYVQNTGFISITPVAGGNPTDDGDFYVAPAIWSGGIDLTDSGTNTNIALTARFDVGNASANIVLLFTDSSFNSAAASFVGFSSSFSTLNIAMSSFTPGFDWSAVTDWSIAGGTGFGDNFRASITNLEATAVPEPTTWALLAAGLTTVMIFRRRRSKF